MSLDLLNYLVLTDDAVWIQRAQELVLGRLLTGLTTKHYK